MVKAALKAELLALLAATLDAADRAHAATLAGATHEEAKAENTKDTRALEQTYLARGQARRTEELRAEVAEVERWAPRSFDAGDAIALGALVTADEDGAARTFFLAPAGGGATLTGGVQVVTPRSPLGLALLGKHAGDDCDLRLAGKQRSLSLLSVR